MSSNKKRLQKSLKHYLSKMKNSKPQVQVSLNNSMTMSKSFILSGCKHTKTQSFAVDEAQGGGGGGGSGKNNQNNQNNHPNDAAAQLEDIDKFLFENFRSLYLRDDDDDVGEKGKERLPVFDSPSRSYFGSSSTSIVDDEFRSSEAITETTIEDHNCHQSSPNSTNLFEGSIAVMRFSSSPYDDFKKSMQEMVDARRSRSDGRVDWEFMQEILVCFINLNDKKSYKYLLNAFVDIVIDLRGETSVGMSVRRKRTDQL